jgi:hypothetical protein
MWHCGTRIWSETRDSQLPAVLAVNVWLFCHYSTRNPAVYLTFSVTYDTSCWMPTRR